MTVAKRQPIISIGQAWTTCREERSSPRMRCQLVTMHLCALSSLKTPSLPGGLRFGPGSALVLAHVKYSSHFLSDCTQTYRHTAYQGVMPKVRRQPTQELHSKGNRDAKPGPAELDSSEVEQWLAVSSCADNWRLGNGTGEPRQCRWRLLSPPRLADPITDRLNMTELTLLPYSEGKRKISRAKRPRRGV